MDDTRLRPLPPSEWPPELANVLKDTNGRSANIHGLMANSPGLLSAWWSFTNYIVRGSSLGQRRTELAILRQSIHMSSWYEWGSHVDRALRLGIEIEEILGLLEPITARPWSEEERALLMAVDDLMKYQKVRPVTLAILNKNYSNQQVIDLVALQGMYQTIASMIKTWGVTLDDEVAERVSRIMDEPTFAKRSEDIIYS